MFRRYEPLIASAIENWPETTKFTPSPDLNLTTFVARLRDSITSFRRYNWSTTLIDAKKFKENDGKFVVAADFNQNAAFFTARKAAGRAPAGLSVPAEFIPTAKPAPSGILSNLTAEELKAIVLLLSNQRILGPVLVDGSPDGLHELAQIYDFGHSYDLTTKTTTLI